jgi:LytR cell envelope-related transcriptional attenuator
MNQRESSSGLPIRAIVMVLLFLGIAFALVGWNATRSSDDSDSTESSSVTTATSASLASSNTPPPPAVKPEVRVYNISEVAGAAEGTAGRLREAAWNVTEVTNLTLEGVTATTVYFGETPGEQNAAEEVGKLLAAPVEPRLPALAEQPPGVIVAVTG